MIEIPTYTWHGSDADVGAAHGKLAKPRVERDLEALDELWKEAEHSPRYRAMLDYLRLEHRDLITEAEGFAEALGMPMAKALFPTIAPAFDTELEKVQNSIVIWRHGREGPVLFRTEDGLPFGEGVDAESATRERVGRLAVIDHSSDESSRNLSLWRLGKLGMQAGVNRHGLLIGYAVGRPCLTDIQEGLPYPLLAAVALRTCKDADDVHYLAKHTPLVGNGANLIFAEASGLISSVEQTGEYTNIRNGGDYQMAVNHQHDEAIQEMIRRADENWLGNDEHKSSMDRAQFIENRMLYIGSRYRLSAREQLQKLIEHRAGAICQHGESNDHRSDYAVLITAGTDEFDIYTGPPCKGNIASFKIPFAEQPSA